MQLDFRIQLETEDMISFSDFHHRLCSTGTTVYSQCTRLHGSFLQKMYLFQLSFDNRCGIAIQNICISFSAVHSAGKHVTDYVHQQYNFYIWSGSLIMSVFFSLPLSIKMLLTIFFSFLYFFSFFSFQLENSAFQEKHLLNN